MLSPKIHRNHMLPSMCIQPPCRNMEVRMFSKWNRRAPGRIGDEGIAGIVVQREFVEKHQDVDDDDQNRDHGLGVARLGIA